mmetsp:Transcript_94218/g.236422  ORF Transcript_94218/g.236422 Transcript_94218/m.236422 type:complete len:99 (-) Transcript_94218:79-375(-)
MAEPANFSNGDTSAASNLVDGGCDATVARRAGLARGAEAPKKHISAKNAGTAMAITIRIPIVCAAEDPAVAEVRTWRHGRLAMRMLFWTIYLHSGPSR